MKVSSERDHNCVPVTEQDLLENSDEDLREAFVALKERTADFGPQKRYNNGRAIMFSRRVCFMFVRPKKSFLELCFFLPRRQSDLGIKRILAVSKSKFSHTFKLVHADQVEEPLIDWLREAFELAE